MSELLDVQAGSPEQYLVLGQGGQYRAIMLTGVEQCTVSVGATYEERDEAKVLKLPLLHHEVELAVEGMDVHETERTAKVDRLIRDRNTTALYIIGQAHQESACGNSGLRKIIGNPRLVATDYRFEEVDESTVLKIAYPGLQPSRQYAGYTQAYVHSVAERLQSTDHKQVKQLIDRYAYLQYALLTYGLFDRGYKFTDNCGEAQSGNLTMFDFGELIHSRDEAYDSLKQQAWGEVVLHPEYTQLQPDLYDYFCDSLKRTLPVRAIDDWGRNKAEFAFPALPAYDIIPSTAMGRILEKAGLIQ